MVGRWLIGLASKAVNKAMERQKMEPTIARYVGNVLTVALNILLIIGILGFFGVETTSFAALIAALGIAIGAAWGGLLPNFAAGAFILVLRPFKVGAYVLAGDVEGTVRSIGLFNTTIDSPDNVLTSVGNGKIMGGTSKNYSRNPYRRVDLPAQLDHTVDPRDAIAGRDSRLRAFLIGCPQWQRKKARHPTTAPPGASRPQPLPRSPRGRGPGRASSSTAACSSSRPP